MERSSIKKLARAAVQLLDQHSLPPVMAALAGHLAAERRVREADLLVRAMAAELLHARRHAAVTLTSARALSAATLDDVTRLLKQRLDAATVTIDTAVVPDLKGGAVLTTPVGTLDASVRSRLNQLKKLS